MSFSEHGSVELAHHHERDRPLCGGFRQKEAAPIKRGGIKQVYLLASLKTQRERRNVARGHPLPNATLAKRVSGRERVAPGGQLSELLGSGLELVVVDQAAGLDDGTLLGRHIGNIELDLLDRTVSAHHVGGDVL